MSTIQIQALQGDQSGNTTYIGVLSFNEVVKLLKLTTEDLPPDAVRQRELNEKRAINFAEYLLTKIDAVIPPLICSIRCPKGKKEEVFTYKNGKLSIPIGTEILINDGQHRRKGIELAIEKNPELGGNSVGVQFHIDDSNNYSKSKQIFADINGTSQPVSKSLSLVMDSRSGDADLVNYIIANSPLEKQQIEYFKDTVAGKNYKLFSYRQFHDFVIGISSELTEKKVGYLQQKPIIKAWVNALFEAVLPEKPEGYTYRDVSKDLKGFTIIPTKVFLKMAERLICLGIKLGKKPESLAALEKLSWDHDDWFNIVVDPESHKLIRNKSAITAGTTHLIKTIGWKTPEQDTTPF